MWERIKKEVRDDYVNVDSQLRLMHTLTHNIWRPIVPTVIKTNLCQWFESFLMGRRQSMRIGKSISRPRNLESGVPQGGIQSPIIFTIFGADLED